MPPGSPSTSRCSPGASRSTERFVAEILPPEPLQQGSGSLEALDAGGRPAPHDASGAIGLSARQTGEQRTHDVQGERVDERGDAGIAQEPLDSGEVVSAQGLHLTLQQHDGGEPSLEDGYSPQLGRERGDVVVQEAAVSPERVADGTADRPNDAPYTRSPPTDGSPSAQVRHSDASARSVRSIKAAAGESTPPSSCRHGLPRRASGRGEPPGACRGRCRVGSSVCDMTGESADEGVRVRAPYEAARVGAFVDAVVAIAMTLLILPLMESVGEVAGSGEDTARWFAEHYQQIISFVLSFVIIAMFWMIHHRLFAGVKQVTPSLMWSTTAWLLTIVWLPVATAITGQMSSDDALAKVVYIGSMIATSACSLLIRVNLLRHPALHRIPKDPLLRGVAADAAMAVLFAAALAIALAVPVVGYFALFIMFLTGPLQAAIARLLLRSPAGSRSAR